MRDVPTTQQLKLTSSDTMYTAHGCPLCGAASVCAFHRDSQRRYLRCSVCRLVFVHPLDLPTRGAEFDHYELHQNDPTDRRYRGFLSRLSIPLLCKLRPGSLGLDFGSGPGPTLHLMFEEAGHSMRVYDPHYAPDSQVFELCYDFITASEVVEHFHQPGVELNKLWSLLRPGGWLGIMTKRLDDESSFGDWHYKRDPTHVSFFAAETFAWLAERWTSPHELVGNDVVLFQKPQPASTRSR